MTKLKLLVTDNPLMRQCGECQLCCRLLPVPPLGKRAGQRCRHQKFGVGCRVYHKPGMPQECGMWNCRWLVNDDTGDIPRPDRAHYVIDIMPDYITLQNNETGEQQNVQVVQIWIDPRYPDAHRDPALRRYLERRAEEGIAALVRFDNRKAITLIPPAMAEDGQWHEVDNGVVEGEHRLDDVVRALT